MCVCKVVNAFLWRASTTRVTKLVINWIMRVTWGLAGVDLEGIEVVLGDGVDHCEGCVL